MKNKIIYIIAAAILLALLATISDPFMLWMPPKAGMAAFLFVAVLMSVWVGLIMYEKATDERDAVHRMYAGHIAYLSGIVVLTIALVTQGLSHSIDPWITGALAIMVVAKLGTRLYSDLYL